VTRFPLNEFSTACGAFVIFRPFFKLLSLLSDDLIDFSTVFFDRYRSIPGLQKFGAL